MDSKLRAFLAENGKFSGDAVGRAKLPNFGEGHQLAPVAALNDFIHPRAEPTECPPLGRQDVFVRRACWEHHVRIKAYPTACQRRLTLFERITRCDLQPPGALAILIKNEIADGSR